MAVDTYHYIDVAGERVVVQDPHTLRYKRLTSENARRRWGSGWLRQRTHVRAWTEESQWSVTRGGHGDFLKGIGFSWFWGKGVNWKWLRGKWNLIFIWPRIFRRIFSVGKYEHVVGNLHLRHYRRKDPSVDKKPNSHRTLPTDLSVGK